MRRHKRWAGLVATVVFGTAAWLIPASPAAAAGTIALDRTSIDFGEQRAGTVDPDGGVVVRATFAGEAVTVDSVTFEGGDSELDFFGGTDCVGDEGEPRTFTAGQTCDTVVFFSPITHGGRNSTLRFSSNATGSPHDVALMGEGTSGYYITGTLGQVAAFGDAVDHGDLSEIDLNAPIVGMATVPNGDGYWLTGTDGGIFAFNADFFGSMGGVRLNRPIVGMAGTPDGEGYYQVASDGGIFSWGSATFHGSTGAIRLNQPVVGMAVTPSGEGYWLVARDGGIFAFGDAQFHGSTGAIRLNQPVVGMAPTPSGGGYWLVARDGGIFAFGDAEFYGSTGAIRLNSPITGMASTPLGDGYWMTAQDGGIFAFRAPFHGSLPSNGITGVNDVVGMAATAPLVDISGATVASGSVGRKLTPAGLAGPTGRPTRSN